MPYEIQAVGTYYKVVNTDTGKKYSEHSTKALATRQLEILKGMEDGSIKKPTPSRTKKYLGVLRKSM